MCSICSEIKMHTRTAISRIGTLAVNIITFHHSHKLHMRIRLDIKLGMLFLIIILMVAALSYYSVSSLKGYEEFVETTVTSKDIKGVLEPVLIVKHRVFAAALILIVTTIFIALITSRFISGSILRLTQGTIAVGKGDLDHKIPIDGNDEIGDLAAAFNQMTFNLKEITASRDELNKEVFQRRRMEEELRSHHEKLLEMVAERTIGLQQVNEELETEIAERTKAEKEARMMALFAELNPSPVLRFGINGNIIIANKAAASLLDSEILQEKPITDVLPDLAGIDFSSCIHNSSIFSHVVRKGDLFYHFIFKGISDMNFGQAYGTDITEQKLAEADSMRVSHLASLGELAAGVAHEINNPINGIINLAQIIVNTSLPGNKEHDLALRIIKEGDRIATIVNGLLSFARTGEKGKYPVPVSEIISDTMILTASLLRKEGIIIQIECPSQLPLIVAKPHQIEQVFLNLISNARYALNKKYSFTNPDKSLHISCEESLDENGLFVRVVIYDKGIGIPADIMDKILNPFFSTKTADKGTGLGLSISHGIISDHGGRLRFESREGEYTKVIVELPAV